MNNKVKQYVEMVEKVLDEIVLEKPVENNKLRYSVDDSDDSLGKKIRRAVAMKIPMILIIGEKDMEGDEVSVRLRDSETKIKLNVLKEYIEKQ